MWNVTGQSCKIQASWRFIALVKILTQQYFNWDKKKLISHICRASDICENIPEFLMLVVKRHPCGIHPVVLNRHTTTQAKYFLSSYMTENTWDKTDKIGLVINSLNVSSHLQLINNMNNKGYYIFIYNVNISSSIPLKCLSSISRRLSAITWT